MVKSVLAGKDFWDPMRAIAAAWFGPSAFQGGAGVVATGLVTHLLTAAGFGVLFLLLIQGRGVRARVIIATTYCIAVWAFMTYIVLPILNPAMYERVVKPSPAWWMILHLVFGTGLALAGALRRALRGATRNGPG